MYTTNASISIPRLFMFGALCAALLVPGIAAAGLGEPEASISDDVAKFQGSIKGEQLAVGYRVHEIQLPSGTVLREFAAPGGNVFAVAWRGPFTPNMKQTLGKYFDNFVAAAQSQPGNRRHVQIQQPDLVLHAIGHMRSFSGVAYLPQSLPGGVTVGELH